MVGMVISVFVNGFSEVYIENSFGKNVVNTWKAPSEGLLLDRIFFKGYNKKEDIP